MKNKKLYPILFLCLSLFIYGLSLHVYTKREETVLTIAYTIGSVGSTVINIQNRLKELGYYQGTVDGIYGQQTFDAVAAFQRSRGLLADGIAGDQTLTALGIPITMPFVPGIYTDDELYILSSVIYGEGRGEPYVGQVAIGAVVLNRVNSPGFPDSIAGVVYQRGAFDAVADGQINLTPNERAINAAIDALQGEDPTGGALYYWNPRTATSEWIWSIPIRLTIGNHVFG